MRPLPLACVLLFGVLLHEAVLVLAGVTAAIVVPPAYFAWFGRAQGWLALALLDLVVFAVPAAIVHAGGVLALHSMLRGGTKALVLGYLAGYLCTVANGTLTLLAASAEGALSPLQSLRSLVPLWWTLPGLLLPWLGFAAAAWLLRDRMAEPR